MKKFFAIAAVAMMALTANAQMYVGGSVCFTSIKDSKDADARNTFVLAPEVGYNLNENWSVGGSIEYTNWTEGDADGDSFGITPYVRYTFCKEGMVNLFVDGGLNYTSFGSKNGSRFGLGVRPGIAVNVNDKISLVAKTGFFGYTKYDKDAGEGSIFGLGVDNSDLSFGVYYNF